MKKKIGCFVCVLLALAAVCAAQPKTESLKVSGECGTCKKKIEKAAKQAGASYAAWDMNTKILTVKYNSASTNTAKIEKTIAGAGYDTPDFKTTTEAYNKLDKCCQYERSSGDVSNAKNKKCADACNKKTE